MLFRSSNNLDEFFRVRVATQLRLMNLDKDIKENLPDKPKKTVQKIQDIVHGFQIRFDAIYAQVVEELKENNIFIVNEVDLCPEHQVFIRSYFKDKIAPGIAPIMISRMEVFPELTDKSIYLAVKLSKKFIPDVHEYSLIEIPTSDLSRFIKLPELDGKKFIILLDDAIRFCLDQVFSILPYDNFEAYTIKITRDAELDVDNDIAESLLEKISKGVKNRTKGEPVRFVYDAQIAQKGRASCKGKF